MPRPDPDPTPPPDLAAIVQSMSVPRRARPRWRMWGIAFVLIVLAVVFGLTTCRRDDPRRSARRRSALHSDSILPEGQKPRDRALSGAHGGLPCG